VLEMVTTHRAAVMDAYGDGEEWQLRVLYPEREALSRSNDFCEAHGLSFEVTYVQ